MTRARDVADTQENIGGAVPPFVAAKNKVINGNFDIWQRSTSSTTNANYGSADRWWMYYGAGTSTFSRESTIVPTGSIYSLKIAQTVATNTNLQINQSIESANAISMAGKTVTISGLFAASASTTLNIDVVYSTATDVTPGGSWTGATVVTSGSGTVSTTASFSRITGVYTIPSTAKSVMARIFSTSVASGTNLYVSQVQLEIGNVPTTFMPAGGTIQGELAACQRYYYRTFPALGGVPFGSASASSTTEATISNRFPVTMRIRPTALEQSGTAAQYAVVFGTTITTCSAVPSYNNATENDFTVNLTVTAGLTTGQGGRAITSVATGASAYLGWSAEL